MSKKKDPKIFSAQTTFPAKTGCLNCLYAAILSKGLSSFKIW